MSQRISDFDNMIKQRHHFIYSAESNPQDSTKYVAAYSLAGLLNRIPSIPHWEASWLAAINVRKLLVHIYPPQSVIHSYRWVNWCNVEGRNWPYVWHDSPVFEVLWVKSAPPTTITLDTYDNNLQWCVALLCYYRNGKVAPRLWNDLPGSLRPIDSFELLKSN